MSPRPPQRCDRHFLVLEAGQACPQCVAAGNVPEYLKPTYAPSAQPVSGLPSDDKARKALPIFTYLMEYFPDAFLAEVAVAVAGNNQHNPGQPLHWAREKSVDQMNTAARHMFDYGRGVKKDTDGQWHLAKAIWRLKAQLQLDIEAERAAEGDASK
jgi:hypothetical protein